MEAGLINGRGEKPWHSREFLIKCELSFFPQGFENMVDSS